MEGPAMGAGGARRRAQEGGRGPGAEVSGRKPRTCC